MHNHFITLSLSSVTSVDIDPQALSIAKQNSESLEVDIQFIQANVFTSLPHMFLHHPVYSFLFGSDLTSPPTGPSMIRGTTHNLIPFDTVLMNPPFGTRNSGADLFFLRVAVMVFDHFFPQIMFFPFSIKLCHGRVYSLHKTSTRKVFFPLSVPLFISLNLSFFSLKSHVGV